MATQSIELFSNESQPQQSSLVGKVETVFFSSADSFYKVLLVAVSENNFDWHEDEIVVTGNFADVQEDATYKFLGKTVKHPKYGLQFQAMNYQNETPTSRTGLITYLAGDDFKGIGKKTATRIVDALGNHAVDKILQDPDVLQPLALKPELQATLIDTLQLNNGMEQAIIGLNGYGFGSQLAAAIYQKYREKTLEVIHNNPYQLVEDIDGVGFKKADQIATQMGMAPDASGRLRAGLLTEINALCVQNGDTYTTADPLLKATMALLENSRNQAIDPRKLADELLGLARDNQIVADKQRIYLKPLYEAEWEIAQHIQRLNNEKSGEPATDKALQAAIQKTSRKVKIDFDESQVAALKAAVQAPVFLLTGGPGTGKTTIINGLVRLFGELHDISLNIGDYVGKPFPILLAAPTGRAAKRMAETTGLPASTIHRLLGLTGRESNPEAVTKDLDGGLLIIDEMSMVDTYLFRTLLHAVPNHMQVVLVGDKDQLPSVGAGQVFHDLLDSNLIPKVELNTIYRQGSKSSIIPLAHAIREGQLPADFLTNQPDRSFFSCNAYQVEHIIEQVVQRAMKKGFTSDEIQILAPMYRGAAGINQLNQMVQKIMNPPKSSRSKEIKFNGQSFRIGDKVLHLVNAPDENVFNGDIGKIVGIDLANDPHNTDKVDKIRIAFDQNEVTYQRNDWMRITLAYCISIHKAQGSQFKMVILPLVPQFSRMLQRNLLYTAVTRAEKILIMLGEPQSFQQSVANESVNRQTTLKERLIQVNQPDFDESAEPKEPDKQQSVGSESTAEVADTESTSNGQTTENSDLQTAGDTSKHQLTGLLVASGQIDPMIGMHGITPQSFM